MAHDGPGFIQRIEGENQPSLDQKEPLLKIKLFIPPARAKRVVRSQLIEQINGGLDKTLILISAPAGYGKTALLAEWAAQADRPVAWISLDAGDNDPYCFLRYVIAALNTTLAHVATSICATSQAMLQSVQPLPIQTIRAALINDITDIPETFVLVLDDLQFINSMAVNELLTFILEHLPPKMRLIIASRVDPAIPLHRLRADRNLLEIRMDDLGFTNAETEAFMNAVMELNLSRQDISILGARTEGWIVGLQMAALSMQGLADRSSFLQALSGSNRYILEYLIEEVLNRQPDTLQSFLLQTSVLERLCAPLCDALLEEPVDSQEILEQLDRSNLFLTPLDNVRHWYRYHHLFADLLRARLQRSLPEMIPALHLRASRWYEEARMPEEAIQHAFAARELERAAWLVERYALEILSRGEMASLLGLFETMPEDLILSRPALGVFHAWAYTFSGQFDKAELRLLEVEKQIRPGETTLEAKTILGNIAVIRSLMADMRGEMDDAIGLAQQADALLPEQSWAERSIIPFVLGDGYFATGELDKAEQAFEQIYQAGRAAGIPWTVSVALHKQALVKKLQGKLVLMKKLYEEAIRFASERGGAQFGSIGATYIGLSDLYREWNELEPAQRMAIQAIKSMEHWHSPTDLVNGYVTLARILLAHGEIGNAENALETAETASRQGYLFPITRVTLEACQVRLWLAMGDLDQANRWLADRKVNATQSGKSRIAIQGLDFVSELNWISVARVLLARSELEQALQVLNALAEASEAGGRNGRLIEILLLSALALQKAGNNSKALEVMMRSLVLAEPEGYMRMYLDESQPMEELLLGCWERAEGGLKAYTEKLLTAFKGEAGGLTDVSAPLRQDASLVEALTEREAEVLSLLADGLSNREIAERLYLSEGTIKTHTHNLYGKLGVQSRTQAIARARELGLI